MVHLALATPVRPSSTSGNDVTTERWARHLIALGHSVTIVPVDPEGEFPTTALDEADMLVALHARRTADAAAYWRKQRGDEPLVVALAGTDLYADLPDHAHARHTIAEADRLIVLQRAAVDRLAGWDPALAAKTVVIHQSVAGPLPDRRPAPDRFVVVVLAHLREVKDPLLCARAARHLPTGSTIVVEHAGAAHDAAWEDAATTEDADNPRYRWLGPLDRLAAAALMARSTVLACTSVLEGGANVVTEAIALGVPVVGTDIDGNRGLLGNDYPGLVPVGDDAAMAALLAELERNPVALADLQRRVDELRPITDPATERAAWADLIAGFT